MLKLIKLALSIVASLGAGAIGTIATVNNIPIWYEALEKPYFNPPNWVFGPVWSILYVLMGISLYLVWTAPYRGSKKWAFVVFWVQLALNTTWSLVFFGLHLPDASIAVIIALLVSILATMRSFWPISKSAVYLLAPYAAWVGFAMILNIAVASLN